MGKPKLTLKSCKRTQRYSPRPVTVQLKNQGDLKQAVTGKLGSPVRTGGISPKQKNAKSHTVTRTQLSAQCRPNTALRSKSVKESPAPTASSGKNTPMKTFHDTYQQFVKNNSPETAKGVNKRVTKESCSDPSSPHTSMEKDTPNASSKLAKKNGVSKKRKVSISKQKWPKNVRTRKKVVKVESVSTSDNIQESQGDKAEDVPLQSELGEGSSSLDISAREKTRVKHNEGRVSVSHASVQVNMECNRTSNYQVCIDVNTNKRVINSVSSPVKSQINTSTLAMSDSSLSQLVTSELERQKFAETHQTDPKSTLTDGVKCDGAASAAGVAVAQMDKVFPSELQQSSLARRGSLPVMVSSHASMLSSDSESGNNAGSDGTSEDELKMKTKCYPLRHKKAKLVDETLPKVTRRQHILCGQSDLSSQTGSKRIAERTVADQNLSKKQKQTTKVTDCSLSMDSQSSDSICDDGSNTSLGKIKSSHLSPVSRVTSPKGGASFIPVLKKVSDSEISPLKDCNIPVLNRISDVEISPVKAVDIKTSLQTEHGNMAAVVMQTDNIEVRQVELERSTLFAKVQEQSPKSETIGTGKTRAFRTRHAKKQNKACEVSSVVLDSKNVSPDSISEVMVPTMTQNISDNEVETEDKSLQGVNEDIKTCGNVENEKKDTVWEQDNDICQQNRCSTRSKRKQRTGKTKGTDFSVNKLSEQLGHDLTLDFSKQSPQSQGTESTSDASVLDVLSSAETQTDVSSENLGKQDNDNSNEVREVCVMVDTKCSSSTIDVMNGNLELSPPVPDNSDVYPDIWEEHFGKSPEREVKTEMNWDVSTLHNLDELTDETPLFESPLVRNDEQSLFQVQKDCGAELEEDLARCDDKMKAVSNYSLSPEGHQALDSCEGDSLTGQEGDDSGLCLLADTHLMEGGKAGIVEYSSTSEEEDLVQVIDQRTEREPKTEVTSQQPAAESYQRTQAESEERKQETPRKRGHQYRVRGKCGWEESLRQRPTRTKLFQAGQGDSTAAGSKGKTDTTVAPATAGECVEGVEEKSQGRSKPDVTKPRTLSRQNSQETEKPTVPVKTSPTKKCDAKSPNTSPTKKRGDTSPKNKVPEAIVLEDDEELARVVEVEPNYGRLVWARLSGERWWPGMVIKGTLIYLQSERNSSSWIYWFGDHKVSQVSHDKIISFSENYKMKIGSFKSKIYRKAVLEALMESSGRSGVCIDTNNDTQLLHWAETGFPSNVPGTQATLDPEPDCPVPESVMFYLREIGKDIRKKAASLDFRNDSMEDAHENAVDAVRKGVKELKDVCIACSDVSQQVKTEHPLFEGGLCASCRNELTETMYAIGDDGLHSFCAVCGAGGDLFVCDSPECKRVYCRPCVEELGGETVLNQVIVASKWQCFLCSPYEDQSECLLHPRSDWQERVIMFFDTGYRVQVPSLDYFKTKRPLRVLSLFDGIGSGLRTLRDPDVTELIPHTTGKLTLDQLGFTVDVYYASEVEQDAIVVTRCNHGSSVCQVGDVTKLDYRELTEMGPIDLLIGGSPCNDLSLANPARRGFQAGSTALLFFEFVRIRDSLQKLNGNTHLFWLYENVASMKTDFKNTMSRFLNCQPALWDSKYMSAQRRGRYFWGNIPGMYSTPAISTHMHENVDLNSVLEQNCNRRATIGKMGCVTTRTNSLKHGKNDELFPVEMEGEATGIWIPEVERLFGYPSHYTDVGNLPVTRRHKLLGKSWSIPIIKQILTPLKRYFATQDSQ